MDDVVELTLRLHQETQTRILVSLTGYEDDAVWLSKRDGVEYYSATDGWAEVRIPQALFDRLKL